MAKHASPQATFYRICKTCEQTQLCSVCNTRKAEQKFAAAAWKRARNGGRVCLDCSGKAWGWWRCSVCNVKQAASAFEGWLAQHRSCNGDQVCSNCWKCPIPRGSISKAVQRIAATQAKAAATAVEEKKARVITDVRAAIAERKREREEDCSQTQGAEPKAKQRREDGQDAITEQKRRKELDNAETRAGEPKEKQCKHETGKAEDKQRALQAAKEQAGTKASKEATLPPKTGKATQREESFQYVCPACHQSVMSSIRTGQVNHRRTCGNRFRVKDGCVVTKAYAYICPACNGQVESNIATGQVNHRKVCGNQFSVKDGVVLEKRFIYKCPFCTKNVTSNVRTGQINHGSGCNNRFYVKDGEISRQRRCHAHYCPVCATVVWSSQSCGRIRIEHDTPAGKRCHKKQWHVPDKEKKNKKRKK